MIGSIYTNQSIFQKYDSSPITDSTNLVTSGAIKLYVDDEISSLSEVVEDNTQQLTLLSNLLSTNYNPSEEMIFDFVNLSFDQETAIVLNFEYVTYSSEIEDIQFISF